MKPQNKVCDANQGVHVHPVLLPYLFAIKVPLLGLVLLSTIEAFS